MLHLRLKCYTYVGMPYRRGRSPRSGSNQPRPRHLSVAQRARYHAILAACKADQGNLPDALAAIQQAMSFAEQAKDGALVALTAAVFLERSCDQAGFEASLPLASYTRRAAARCGDAQTLASVHLTFARLEGRCGRYQTALRHLAAGRELLKGDPNELTSAILDLDESGVLFLMEDAAGALETASRASIAAGQSGWSRGELVAKLNIAQCLVALDRLDEAETQLDDAKASKSHSVPYDVGLADTEAQLAICRGDLLKAQGFLDSVEPLISKVPQWYALTNQLTRNRLLLCLKRSEEAKRQIDLAIAEAEKTHNYHLMSKFRMQLLEALIQSSLPAAHLISAALGPDRAASGSLAALGCLAAGRANLAAGAVSRGGGQIRRAARLLKQVGDKASEFDARMILNGLPTSEPDGDEGRGHLDAAVALLELSGHPHILAREAVALLQDSGCVEALALATTGPRGPAVLAADGWTTAEALAAVRAAAPADFIVAR